METGKRTLVKALCWNLIGLATMSGVGYAATGSVALGGAMAMWNTVLGLSLYILYERFWAGIGWGRRG